MEGQSVKKILIVGGGTAGWLAASHLAKKLQSSTQQGIKVTLVESPDIPTIGVGEGTVPAIRESLKYLGISETDFIRQCDVTFKQSIKFVDWCHPSNTERNDAYHHVFDYPYIDQVDLVPYWLAGRHADMSFVDALSIQGRICDLGLGPKLITDAEYAGMASYAYHLDASKFAEFLANHAIDHLGVERIRANVSDINLDEGGNIKSVVTDRYGEIEADFFVDSTGFTGLLVEQKLGIGFIDKSDILFVDHAIAAQVPYGAGNDAIPCQTLSTAREAGWIWDIGLADRRGTGYVYSASHITAEQAEGTFRDYLRQSIGHKVDDITCRSIKMRIGYREKFWHKNCVAIGLSQGFVEPLEATGLLVFDATARMLADIFPGRKESFPAIANQFNHLVKHAWDRVIDFIKLHYLLSKRHDHQFWRDNHNPETVPQSLVQLLERWRFNMPSEYDFPGRFEIFTRENYLYVLYGMGFKTNIEANKYQYGDRERAEDEFKYIQTALDHVSSQLLPHRELLTQIKKYGLQKI